MNETAKQYEVDQLGFWIEIYEDPFNKRVRVDDYYGDTNNIIEYMEELMKRSQLEKLIIKVRSEHFHPFLENGYICEAVIDDYYLGSKMFFFTKYFESKRLINDHWLTEDQMLKSIHQLEIQKDTVTPPKDYHLKRVEQHDAERLAKVYRTVFQIYPTPLHDVEYIKKTISEGTIYYAFYCNGEIVSAASAEVNQVYRNAELTDCATLPDHRKHGLMKILLKKLEEELFRGGIYCSYSIARSLSFGMNACLHQLGYKYRGRLKNNVFIYDKLENMNVWVKNLALEPNIRQ
ncbi:putative beta-lysine N-acetyltransferase [Pseudoneobacillus sp. C159]